MIIKDLRAIALQKETEAKKQLETAELIRMAADDLSERYGGSRTHTQSAEQPELNEPETAPISDEVLLELAKSKAEIHGKKAIKELLGKFECPNVSGLPQEKRSAFKTELEAM
jgi:DTW domain-containing protein YfiP